ncbi:non-heme iron oxygenase ferredoxin subunit [Mycolicibacterium sp. P9-22]|uniref:non-heme iron oxygenase ferredoxin subunit n=1 Tax=Mycolicibacterium sp. P9-22 TaxID=2024613 RepID=UPI0011F09864|nr:non-heme iron oxygenase ferredoxin subunit [Mycolicibacterium sp. P9-22]KAA0109965.1 non-heme iron oxygenase ferredoxin subunit [Mycolicibacterium sp. P9-22]
MPEKMACKVDDLADGESKTVDVEPAIAIHRVDGEFFATDDTCTHEDWSLGDDGLLDGHQLECCLHQGRFDVRTGEATQFPATDPLCTYPVRVSDGEVWVELP